MPIYMDYHFNPGGVTLEEVKRAHVADVNTQERFNVKYHQFWINEAAGTVFCLMEGPSAEACAEVHREAHGNVACNVIEVNPTLVEVFLGKPHKIDHGVVYDFDNEVDSGFRYILVVNLIAKTNAQTYENLQNFTFPVDARQFALKTISAFRGNEISNLKDDDMIFVFQNSSQILSCATALKKRYDFDNQNDSLFEYRMALHFGQPVTEQEGLFEDSISYTKQLAIIANDTNIIASSSFNKVHESKYSEFEKDMIHVVSNKQEAFIRSFFQCRDNAQMNGNVSIQDLCIEIGISRAQLYRKILDITGRSPLQFIRDLRMKKALFLMKNENLNVSEVALEVGYSNPSHFSKCFHDRFGVLPSKFI